MARVFGAYLNALQHRKRCDGLTRRELASRSGKDETAVSRLFNGPANWTLRTIADLSVALDVKVEFKLVDRRDSNISFLDNGIEKQQSSSGPALPHAHILKIHMPNLPDIHAQSFVNKQLLDSVTRSADYNLFDARKTNAPMTDKSAFVYVSHKV
jgi:transcriptional regulator with XRE-family HTH domain